MTGTATNLNISKIRKLYHITQAELSSISGISKASISRLESGRQNPSLTVMAALANALNCTIADLMDPPHPSHAELEIRKKLEKARAPKPTPEEEAELREMKERIERVGEEMIREGLV